MKRLKIGMLAAAAMLLATGTGARAASGVLDFQGFTITYNTTGQWDQLSLEPEDFRTDYNAKCDLSNHCTPLGSGLEVDYGVARFVAPQGPNLKSYDGQGSSSLQSTFSYTVQAKAGWQMSYIGAHQYQGGYYMDFKGGTTSTSATGNASVTGGAAPTFSTSAEDFVSATNDNIHAGVWRTSYSMSAYGNRVDTNYETVYDSNGNAIGQTRTFTIAERVSTPLTGATGSFVQALSASTTGPGQIAYLTGSNNTFFYMTAHAMRAVSAVPEPDTYAMMAASLGLIGFAARRKSKKSA